MRVFAFFRLYGIKQKVEGQPVNELHAMFEAITFELIRIYPHHYCSSGSWEVPLVHTVNGHLNEYTHLPFVRLGFTKAQDAALKDERNADTEYVDAEQYQDEIEEHKNNSKNVPILPTKGKVYVEKREHVRKLLKAYIDNFDKAVYTFIQTTELEVKEEVQEANAYTTF